MFWWHSGDLQLLPISVEFMKQSDETQDGGVCLEFFCVRFCLRWVVIGIRRPKCGPTLSSLLGFFCAIWKEYDGSLMEVHLGYSGRISASLSLVITVIRFNTDAGYSAFSGSFESADADAINFVWDMVSWAGSAILITWRLFYWQVRLFSRVRLDPSNKHSMASSHAASREIRSGDLLLRFTTDVDKHQPIWLNDDHPLYGGGFNYLYYIGHAFLSPALFWFVLSPWYFAVRSTIFWVKKAGGR